MKKFLSKVMILLLVTVLAVPLGEIPLSTYLESNQTLVSADGLKEIKTVKDVEELTKRKVHTADEKTATPTLEEVVGEEEAKKDIKTLTTNEKGEVLYGDTPVYVGAGNEKIPAKLDDLMKKGVESELSIASTLKDSLTTKTASASTAPTIVYVGQISYGGSMVGEFRVNGEPAYCVQHHKPTPPTGSDFKTPVPYNNAKIARAMYYGYFGPENIFGSDKSRGIVVTSLVLSRLYNGVNAGGNNIKGYSELWDIAQNGEVIDHKQSLSKSNLTTTVKGSVQVTEMIKYNAVEKNSITFYLPEGVTLVTASGTKMTGRVTITGGKEFYFQAPLDYVGKIDTGTLNGTIKAFQPFLSVPNNTAIQTLGYAEWFTDPTNGVRLQVTFSKKEVELEVNYLDVATKAPVAPKKTRPIKPGDKYNEPPINISNLNYIRSDGDPQSGTAKGENIVINHYYVGQVANAGLEKVQIYTAKANEGLPVKVDLRVNVSFNTDHLDLSIEEDYNTFIWLINQKIDVALYDGNQKIDYKRFYLDGVPSKVEFHIPANRLSVGQQKPYTVRLENYNDSLFSVPSNQQSITTDGHTATEGTVSFDVKSEPNVEQVNSYVVMTEKTTSTPMVEYFEYIRYKVVPFEEQKTGYGLATKVDVTYTNELGSNYQLATRVADNTTVDFFAPSVLRDSYVDYEVEGSDIKIPLELGNGTEVVMPNNPNRGLAGIAKANSLKNQETDDGKGTLAVKSPLKMEETVFEKNYMASMFNVANLGSRGNNRTESFKFPSVYVERETGNLFSPSQVSNRDSRLTNPVRDGGNKFYTPIWADLGNYSVKYETNTIGAHKMNFEFTDSIDLYAHMFAHIDSDTVDQDEILLVPINAENPFAYGAPDNWTAEDINWLKY